MPASLASVQETSPTADADSHSELAQRAWVKLLEVARRIDSLVTVIPNLKSAYSVEALVSGALDGHGILKGFLEHSGVRDVSIAASEIEDTIADLVGVAAMAIALSNRPAELQDYLGRDHMEGDLLLALRNTANRISARVASSWCEADTSVPELWLSGSARRGEYHSE